jgi:hypothetical protein
MNTMDFKECPNCKARVTLRPSPHSDSDWNRRLAKLVSCNRCSDFFMERFKVRETICNLAWEIYNFTRVGTNKPNAIQQCREAIIAATKKLASLECEFYNLQNFWEMEFAQMIFEKPEKVTRILKDYSSRIYKASGSKNVKA